MPTWVLTERVGTECPVAPEDVDFLLAKHRRHLDLVPTGRRGWYRLTPTGHVGTIVAPGCRLVLRPKIPLRNLFHLLDPAGPLPTVEDHSTAVSGADLLDFLAGRLVHRMTERAAAGLQRGYVERSEAGPYLQGRLDIAAQVRHAGAAANRLHCRYEDLTTAIPCNQIPRATADLVLRSPLLGDNVRLALRQAQAAYAEVPPAALDEGAFAAAGVDRLTEDYRPLLDLCRLLVDGLAPGEYSGRTAGPAFLLDLERVFERYVTAGVTQALTGQEALTAAVQATYTVNRPVAGTPDLPMRPDVTLHAATRPVLVLDAKWKRLARSGPEPADLYQVLAYCTGLGVRRACLVYPGSRGPWQFTFARSPVRVEVRTLRVNGTREACGRSLQRFGATVLAWGRAARRSRKDEE